MTQGASGPGHDFERFFDLSLDLLCIAGADGYFRRVNPSFQRVLGWSPEELTRRPFVDWVHPDDVGATLREVERLASGQPTMSFRNRYRCVDGSYRQLLWTAVPEPVTGLLFGVARDTTELIEANQRLELAIDAFPAALIMVDGQGRVRLANREAERIFDYPRELMVGQAVEMLVPSGGREQHDRERAAFVAAPRPRLMGTSREVRAVRRDGSTFPAEVGLASVQLSDGAYVVCTIVDRTLPKQAEERMLRLTQELEAANAELARVAVTDRLTGVLNRRAFDEELDRQVQLMGRMGRAISLLMVDLDHFKQYNDCYGHPAGDEVLRTVAGLLRRSARASDAVARYGGDEFAVILPDTDEAGAVQLAERFQAAMRAHPWGRARMAASIGAATMGFGEETGRSLGEPGVRLLARADGALYHSKGGGDRVTHASEMGGADETPVRTPRA